MAEREGFEPSEPFPAHRFSRAASSTTPASLHRYHFNRLVKSVATKG